ncbi:MAG: hypothetical protein PUP92_32575, partial [Rhizonema sp. PD38]|nr:hypothetical protein [Rhizonema sp. PD38]
MTQIPGAGDVRGAIVPVEIITSNELTFEEQRERQYLERVVEKSFYEAGKALRELRDRKLYRSTHKTFFEYCKDRFGYSSRRLPDLLIEAAAIVNNLSEKCDPLDLILPTNERQVRPLTKLEPDQQWEAWQLSVEKAGGKVPTARIVSDVVQHITERTNVPKNSHYLGQVCQILSRNNPELKGKSLCWCIVSKVNDFSCTVTAWDGEYIVKIDHLKSLDYSDADCKQVQLLCDRITKLLHLNDLEDATYAVLTHLGEIKRPY